MPQPIGSYGRDYSYGNWNEPEPPVSKAARDYCARAHSVISGYLCDEPTTISDACREGKSEVDRTLCDDRKLQAAQDGVWSATKEILKTIVSTIIGRMDK